MIENILLLSCRSPFLDNDRIYPALANLYLHQSIKQRNPNINVKVTDDYNLTNSEWLEEIDLVGISIMTPQRNEANKILNFVKKHKPNMPVIAGGPHVKHYLDDMLFDPWDFLIPQDGLNPINKIINGLANERILKDFMSGRSYADNWVKPNRLGNADYLRSFNYILRGRNSTSAMFAQGCPMRCQFCEDAMTAVRWTPDHLIQEELDDIVSLGYKGVYIFDDIFAIAMPKVRPICEALQKRDLAYRCNGQANFFTKWGEDFAKLLSDTGAVEIAFGHESGSQRILDRIDKRTTVEQNRLSIEYAKKHGLHVKSFMMVGLPGETYETIDETVRFLEETRPDDIQFAVFYPYAGTEIRRQMDSNEVDDIYFIGEGIGAYGQKGGSSESRVGTSAFAPEELLRIRDELVIRFKPKSHTKKWDDKFFQTQEGNDCIP